MNDRSFAELVGSIREGGAILCGEVAPSRTFAIAVLDVKRARSAAETPRRRRTGSVRRPAAPLSPRRRAPGPG